MHVDFDDVQIDSVGLNHLSWVRSVRVNGTDVTDEVVEGYAREVERDAAESGDPEWDPDSVRLMRAIPNSYLRYYYETRMMLAHQSDSPTRASEVMQIETELLKQYEDAGLDKKPDELMQRGGAYYSDSAVELMADIHNDAGTTHVVNVRNDGAIPGMDPSVVMEIPALIDRRGATALAGDAMRSDIDSLVRTVKDFELLTIEAAVSGDEDSALRALVTNPLGPDMSAAREVWRRLKEENQGLLGKFG
jgi:6-phospho-beta-glucosidase